MQLIARQAGVRSLWPSYRAALRCKGAAMAEAGGTAALLDALARVRAADPDRGNDREAIIAQAWAGLAGWQP